jgi:chemotaxis protein CheX
MSTRAAPTDEDLLSITEQVWASYLDPEGVSPLIPLPPGDLPRDISASVSVTGAWKGHIVVACSTPGAKNAAGALLGIDLADVTPEDITDAVGELVNIIGGNVKGLMPEPSALSLPVVVINGQSGWPSAVEVCHLDGEWLGEPMAVRVLESSVEEKA